MCHSAGLTNVPARVVSEAALVRPPLRHPCQLVIPGLRKVATKTVCLFGM